MARRLPGIRAFIVLIPILLLLAAASLQPRPVSAAPAAQKPIPHDLVGKEDCLACHAAAIKPVPATHASYTNAMCQSCHKPAAAAQPAAPAAAPTAAAAAEPTKAPAAPGSPSLIPHSLEGRAVCTTCHGPAGMKPFPKNHAGYTDNQCQSCHVPASSSKAPTPAVPAPTSPDAASCLNCHKNPDMTMTLSSGQKLKLTVNEDAFRRSVHGSKGLPCTACHPGNAVYPHPTITVAVARELNRSIIQEACAKCHTAQFAQYKDSVHGKELLGKNNLDVPSCTDCHGIHAIRDPQTALFRNESPDVCSKCHADAKLMAKYNISSNVTKTYLNDFHGASVRLTAEKDPNITSYKAVCYDCHGIHDIKVVTDPNSSVVKNNLVQTCQKCHPDATTNFPAAWTSHFEPNREKWPLVYLVNLFYKIFIPTILIGMVAYIGLDLARTAIDRSKARRKQ